MGYAAKGAYFMGNRIFEVQEQSLPALGDGDVLIKNMACGVCGTDVHIYHGEAGSADVSPPVILGHEYSGEIVETGRAVSAVKPGDKVTVDPNIYCGECRYCRNGKKQLCENMRAIGVTRDGGFAQYSVVPAAQTFLLSPDVSYELGAMAEPLACCIHGVDLAGVRTGDTVCVIGGGAIGLLMVQLAKLGGAGCVILSEPIAMRREIGKRLGADLCLDPIKQNLSDEIKKRAGLCGADVVIECAGNTSAIKQAFEIAAKGATLMLFSVPNPDATFDLPLFDVFKKELKIQGSFVNPDTHARAVQMINAGKIIMNPIITHRFRLDEIEQAVQTQMDDKSIKVIVEPNKV